MCVCVFESVEMNHFTSLSSILPQHGMRVCVCVYESMYVSGCVFCSTFENVENFVHVCVYVYVCGCVLCMCLCE
jgi:hypothetical protein